jgi:hypothetical protein
MFDFFNSYIVVACGNYFIIIVNVAQKETTMLQLMYNVHTRNNEKCSHFHHPLWDTFATDFQL